MNQGLKIHIVSFDVPAPPDYGGVIDVYYKIKSLSESGVKVILHCFQYGRQKSAELEKICFKVYYYQRGGGIKYLFSQLPYIVATRSAGELLANLAAVEAPILFEGLHTCFFIGHPKLDGYKKIVRMHNIEHEYYRHLALAEKNLLKKVHYLLESRKLKRYEPAVGFAETVVTISPSDQEYFSGRHKNPVLLTAFHGFEKVTSKQGKGDYFLFHGKLSVGENIKAATFLMEKVFDSPEFQLIVAGKNPGRRLFKIAAGLPNVKIISNPDGKTMKELIENAQGCILPTFQPTGLKLKLLSSLYSGRFCIANQMMAGDTGFENLCIIADTPAEFKEALKNVAKRNFPQEEIQKRRQILEGRFSDQIKAQILLGFLKQEE